MELLRHIRFKCSVQSYCNGCFSVMRLRADPAPDRPVTRHIDVSYHHAHHRSIIICRHTPVVSVALIAKVRSCAPVLASAASSSKKQRLRKLLFMMTGMSESLDAKALLPNWLISSPHLTDISTVQALRWTVHEWKRVKIVTLCTADI